MSEEGITSFFQKVSGESALREEFKAAIESAVVGLAARHGCEFTADELARKLAGEMSDEDLEAVAGGTTRLMASQDMSSELLLAGLTRGLTSSPLDPSMAGIGGKW